MHTLLKVLTLLSLMFICVTCRAKEHSCRTAGIVRSLDLRENDSVSITGVSRAAMIDESHLSICEVQTNRILIYDVRDGTISAASAPFENALDSLYEDLKGSYIDSVFSLQPLSNRTKGMRPHGQWFLGYHTFALAETGSLATLLQAEYPVKLQNGRETSFPLIARVELDPHDLHVTSVVGLEFSRQVWARRYSIVPLPNGEAWISAVAGRENSSELFIMRRYDHNGKIVVGKSALSNDRVVSTTLDGLQNSAAILNRNVFVRTGHSRLVVTAVNSVTGGVVEVGIPPVVTEVLSVSSKEIAVSDPARLSDSTFAVIVWRATRGDVSNHQCVLFVGKIDQQALGVQWVDEMILDSNDPVLAIVEPAKNRTGRIEADAIKVVCVDKTRGPYVGAVLESGSLK